MARVRSMVALAVAGVAGLAAPRVAAACGGCFGPPDTVTVVDGHRMAIALTADKTILWDQIRYSGDPDDFVWVLPVPAPPDIALADPEFFPGLERRTAPVILPPFCAGSSGCGGGCGGASADNGAVDAGGGDVTIYGEEVVGPYETVTIGSEDPEALRTWLLENGYLVPEAAAPAMAYYVDQGSLFLVMRLAPGAGVDAMQPVRVTYAGYMGSFPLRMVTVGAVGLLDLTLWVIADQRYQAWSYPTVEIDDADLTFGFDGSNYDTLFRDAIDGAGGRGWVAEYAKPFPYFAVEDVDVALDRLASPFLTRLRTSMLVDHIDTDLTLAPDDRDWILQYRRVPSRSCPSNGDCATGEWVSAPFGFLLLALVAWPRRRRRA